jgi:hypothetical protein
MFFTRVVMVAGFILGCTPAPQPSLGTVPMVDVSRLVKTHQPGGGYHRLHTGRAYAILF